MFVARVGVAQEAFGAGWKRAKADPKALPKDARMMSRISEAHGRALAQSKPLVDTLLTTVLEMTIESISDELAWCEKTLAEKYAGLTEEAMLRVRSAGPEVWLTPRSTAYAVTADAAGTTFTAKAKQQVQYTAQYADDQARAGQRLFATTPIHVKGNGGRGIWWRTPSDLNAAIVEASITLQSQVRNAAMQAFNEAGEDR